MATTTSSPTISIIIGAIFAVVIIGAIVMAIRRREIVFDGEVIDKNITETRNAMPMNNMGNMNSGGINMMSGGIQHEYYIKVKTANGKTIKYKISSGMYETVKIGDTVSKPTGTSEITITSSQTPIANAATPQLISPATPTSVETSPKTPIAPTITPPSVS
jgi:hypothetical protein